MGNICLGEEKHSGSNLARLKERRRSSRANKAAEDIMTFPAEKETIEDFIAKIPANKNPTQIKDSPRRRRRVSCTPSIGMINEETNAMFQRDSSRSISRGSSRHLRARRPSLEEELGSCLITTPSEFSVILQQTGMTDTARASQEKIKYMN